MASTATLYFVSTSITPQGDVIGEFPRLQSVGILEDPNGLAQYLLVAASLLTLAWAPGRWRRNVALVMLPAAYLLYGILVTHSRGGLVGLSIVVFFPVREKDSGKIISFVLVGYVAFSLVLGRSSGPTFLSRIATRQLPAASKCGNPESVCFDRRRHLAWATRCSVFTTRLLPHIIHSCCVWRSWGYLAAYFGLASSSTHSGI